MSEIKPCPFCGGHPEVGVEFYESCGSEVKLRAEVWCERCHIGRSVIFKATEIGIVPFERYTDAFKMAIKKWNTRVGENNEHDKQAD